ncbi:hypothetical protein PG990_007191 [Apiospora arundinis]
MTDNLTGENSVMDPQNGSTFARFPAEIHLLIAMKCTSDEAVFALLKTCKMLSGVYRDLLYERNIRYDEGSALFKIARNGEVAAFGHLERIAGTMDEGMPDLNRLQLEVEGGPKYIGTLDTSRDEPVHAFTALHWAASKGHSEAAQWLIDRNADCDALGGSKYKEESFHEMVRGVRPFRSLLPPEIVDYYNHGRGTPLCFAVYGGHLETCRRLCAAGAKTFSQPRPRATLTALHLAVISGHVDIIREFVDNEVANPRKKDRRAWRVGSAIQWAALSKQSRRSIRCFFELGEDIIPALDWLLALQLPSEVNWVLNSINIDLRDSTLEDRSTNQATAILTSCMRHAEDIDCAEEWGSLLELVMSLIRSGADVNYTSRLAPRTWFLKSALLETQDDGSITQLLLENGAEVSRLHEGERSVFVMYLKGLLDTMGLSDFEKRHDGLYVAEFKMDLLLKYGADPEMESTLDGRDPLYYATELVRLATTPANLAILNRLCSYDLSSVYNCW